MDQVFELYLVDNENGNNKFKDKLCVSLKYSITNLFGQD